MYRREGFAKRAYNHTDNRQAGTGLLRRNLKSRYRTTGKPYLFLCMHTMVTELLVILVRSLRVLVELRLKKPQKRCRV